MDLKRGALSAEPLSGLTGVTLISSMNTGFDGVIYENLGCGAISKVGSVVVSSFGCT